MRRREAVRVAVIFEPGRGLRLVWFSRGQHKHTVRETTYRWQGRRGDKPELHFAVSDGEALFELIYSPLDGTWTLIDQQAPA